MCLVRPIVVDFPAVFSRTIELSLSLPNWRPSFLRGVLRVSSFSFSVLSFFVWSPCDPYSLINMKLRSRRTPHSCRRLSLFHSFLADCFSVFLAWGVFLVGVLVCERYCFSTNEFFCPVSLSSFACFFIHATSSTFLPRKFIILRVFFSFMPLVRLCSHFVSFACRVQILLPCVAFFNQVMAMSYLFMTVWI